MKSIDTTTHKRVATRGIAWGSALLAVLGTASILAQGPEEGFVPLFDGQTLDGWVKRGGDAAYRVDNGAIVGECLPSRMNTFLCSEKEFGNFILKLEFKFDVPGNSGVQFRSAARPEGEGRERVYGYQAEMDPNPKGDTARIYDEGRRGHQHGIIWMDTTSDETLAAARATNKPGDWNALEIQCVGPSIRTWLNGVAVANLFDDQSLSGFFGLQVHVGDQGKVRWRNIRVKDLGRSEWTPFFLKGADGKYKLNGAHFVLPNDWSFEHEKGYLKGVHRQDEKRDGLVVSDGSYDNFIARVTYRIFGGNSALYFRAEEVNTPWLLKGFQNEIAGNNKDSALWHTAGDKTPGRGWVAANDELVGKVRKVDDWNTTCTAACGDRIVSILNGFKTVDIVDPLCEKSGKVALQLHGSANVEMWFKDFEILVITREMKALIDR